MRFKTPPVVVGGVLLALSACGSPPSEGQSDAPGTAPRATVPSPTFVVEDPAASEYVADLALYLPDAAVDYAPADVETITTAAATLIQSCMAERGVNVSLLGLVAAADVEADRTARLRRLLFDERDAVLSHGYDTVLAGQDESTASPTTSLASEGVNEHSLECRGQAYAEISGDPSAFLANLPPSASEVGKHFEGIFDADSLGAPLVEWERCMQTAGYAAPTLGARLEVGRQGTEEEKKMALVDHDCRTATGLRTAIAEVMAERVETYLAENDAEVDEYRDRQASELAKAQEVLARASES